MHIIKVALQNIVFISQLPDCCLPGTKSGCTPNRSGTMTFSSLSYLSLILFLFTRERPLLDVSPPSSLPSIFCFSGRHQCMSRCTLLIPTRGSSPAGDESPTSLQGAKRERPEPSMECVCTMFTEEFINAFGYKWSDTHLTHTGKTTIIKWGQGQVQKEGSDGGESS